ncbi:MAG: ureidoglycolate lyase, partial [Lachnospiraceae bacterium]|nr:ureidoglycolate lyase [Lachnospiraceae bacterium]
MGIQLESICSETFARFGSVIEFPVDFEENFCIIETDEKNPWRVAVFRYDNKEIQTIECHPTSKETFEPLEGVTILLVAEHERPEEYRAFLLDKPVCLHKGVWHQTLAVTKQASVKITENLEVESVFYELKKPVSVYVG